VGCRIRLIAIAIPAILIGVAIAAVNVAMPVYSQAPSTKRSHTPSPSQADERERANQNTVTIISGTPAGTYLAIAYDMSAVLDDGDNLRVLAVAGKGSVQNVRDILNLRGIDMGIVQSDVMAHFRSELGPSIDQRLVYITKLYNEEMHLVVNAQIKDIKDLAGKKVNFAEVNSGTQFSSRAIFRLLGIQVEEVNLGQADALVKIRSGEIAGSVFIVGRPAAALTKLTKDQELHLLPVPFTDALEENSYLPAKLASQDYPGLIAEGEQIDTIAIAAVLAVYNWQPTNDRHRRVSKFITAFFEKFDEFQKPARHPKWKEVNLTAKVKGWNRFPAATEWLDTALAQQDRPFKIDPALARQQAARAARDPKSQERLFQQFMQWSRNQQRN
jgi:TRAP transporter TAXI family solute receptor